MVTDTDQIIKRYQFVKMVKLVQNSYISISNINLFKSNYHFQTLTKLEREKFVKMAKLMQINEHHKFLKSEVDGWEYNNLDLMQLVLIK